MEIDYICNNEKCCVCDYENLKNVLGVDKLVKKDMGGKSNVVHNDIIKKYRIGEKQQKVFVNEAKIIKKNILKLLDTLHILQKIYNKSNNIDRECEKFEKNYPYCNRVWQGDEDTHIKLKSYTFEIEEIEHEISEFLKNFYK